MANIIEIASLDAPALAPYARLTEAQAGSDAANIRTTAVRDGDVLIAFRLENDCARGDIVVYSYEGKRCVGRVAARETDVVVLSEDGTLLVNGTAQAGEIMYPTYPEEGLGYPYTVPDGCVFILGDYRTQSQDSRDFGAIALDDVEAKVITVIRRRSL